MECLSSLERQTQPDFEVIIVDNSGAGLVRRTEAASAGATIIEQDQNIGFGAAVNKGFYRSRGAFLATLNDDTVAHAGWLQGLTAAMGSSPEVGMCAPQVRLFGEQRLDSAGMLVGGDGSSKQRGHRMPPSAFSTEEEVLFPSGSAALYRRAMLDQIGLFDEAFFLYCEDADLGLRARWAGWKCLYVPEAVVEHHYSHSAGRVSTLKAYHVERNRLFVLVKDFPASMLLMAPFVTLARFWWHLFFMFQARGSSGRFRSEGGSGLQLLSIVLRAHYALILHWRCLWRKRRDIQRLARLSAKDFRDLLRAHSISARHMAEL